MARTFLVEHAGELSALEGAAIGRYLVSREREVARLRRTIGAPWRGVAGRHIPAHARAGRRGPVGVAGRRLRSPAVGEVGEPIAPARPGVLDREDDALA